MVDSSSVGGQLDGLPRSRRSSPHDRVEAPALDILHEVIMVPFLMPAAENRHDIGVVQPRRRPRFPLEPLDLLGFHEQARRQDLERDAPAQPFFLGLVNHSHPAAAHLADDPEAVDRPDTHAADGADRSAASAATDLCFSDGRILVVPIESTARCRNIQVERPRPAGFEAIEQAGVLLGYARGPMAEACGRSPRRA